MNATAIVRDALAGSGIELVASCPVGDWDAAAPAGFGSAALAPGARGVVVAASAGSRLWRAFRAATRAEPALADVVHPYDAFVRRLLVRADRALAGAGVAFRRFEPTLDARPRIDFLALGRLAGLGSPGPFGMLVSREHGAWWALRGAWLVGAEVDGPLPHDPPCAGCTAPCVGGVGPASAARGIAEATPEVRARCIYGAASRYDDDQIAYHYGRDRAGLAALRRP